MNLEVVNIFSALLTPTIAIIATYVAVQQYQLTKLKIRFELYDRRSAAYQAVVNFVSSITRTGKVEEAALREFVRNSAESHFLFRSDVRQYMELLYRKALTLELASRNCEREKTAAGMSERAVEDEHQELLQWFNGQFEVAREKFRKYLDLGA